MVQRLRALATLAKDWSHYQNQQWASHIHSCNSNCRGSKALFWSPQAPTHKSAHIHRAMYKHIKKIFSESITLICSEDIILSHSTFSSFLLILCVRVSMQVHSLEEQWVISLALSSYILSALALWSSLRLKRSDIQVPRRLGIGHSLSSVQHWLL